MHLKKTRGGSEWGDRPFTVAEACMSGLRARKLNGEEGALVRKEQYV